MALYKIEEGKINGIDYSKVFTVLTQQGLNASIRIAGDSVPFIIAPISDFIKSDNSAFTFAELIVHFHTYFNKLDTTGGGTVSSGGTYNATEPTLTDGQNAPLQTDVNGYLKTKLKAADVTAIQTAGVTMHPTHFSPQHFSVARTSDSIITCTPLYGLPAIDGNTMNVLSVKIDRADNTTVTYINGKDGVKFTASVNTITIYKDGVMQSPFLGTDSKYRVAVNYIEIGDDPSTDTNKVTVENFPLMPSTAPLVDLSNQTTLTDYYYPSADGLDMSAYSGISIQGVITNVTASVEVTNDETPANWVDITKAGYELVTNSSGNTSIIATSSTSFMLDFDRLNCRLVRVKYRTTNGTNVMKCYINRK